MSIFASKAAFKAFDIRTETRRIGLRIKGSLKDNDQKLISVRLKAKKTVEI